MIQLQMVLALAVVAAAWPASAGAQTTETLSGRVVDPVGTAAVRVVVQLKGTGGEAHQATTDVSGKYEIGTLPAGTYDVSVTVPGLKAFERKGVRVRGGSTTLDIRLEEGTQLSTLGEDPAGIAADRLRHKPPTGPAPRTSEGRPDLSGVWWTPTVTSPGTPEWLPVAQKVASERQANNRKDSPQVRCLPAGVLRRGPLHEFVQSKSVIAEISDDDSPGFHQIYLDRDHPKEPDALWYGDSVGKWDGDTLVVDRVNFVDEVWLDGDGHPHSDRLHIIERYHRTDLGHLEAEITVEDSAILARPWTFTRVSELAPSEQIREFVCENNSDLQHILP